MSATPAGTKIYSERFKEALKAGHFRPAQNLFLSSVGIGTYLGEMDDKTDETSYEAMTKALREGVNVIDSAINYRAQRSERVIGKVIGDLAKEGFKREEFFISTKGGFIPFDGGYPVNPPEFFHKNFIESGILMEGDVIQGCHAMTPKYLENQIDQSLKNLNFETIDLYYLHNPETQLDEISENDFYGRLKNAFQLFEEKVSQGKIKMYGTATWNGLRVSNSTRGYLSFKKILEAAELAGGKNHHLKAVQLPYNLGMPEAFTSENQDWNGEQVSAIEFARRANISVFTSASLLQGRLAKQLPPKIKSLFPNCKTAAAASLQFVRSTPGISTALVGMKSSQHVDENLEVKNIPPLDPETFTNLFTASS